MASSIRVALITGGASGLGQLVSRTFLEQGYHVAINYLNSEESAQNMASGAGGRALAIKADVGDAEQVASMLGHIEEAFGRLDLLINNAGITINSLLIRQTEAQWDAVIRTNLTGSFNVIRSAAPLMIRSGGGHILNISSYSGVQGKAGQAAYSASKAGLVGLTISAACELAEHHIRVNAIVPGYMHTPMGTEAITAMRQAEEQSILKALSEPSAVADSIAMIAGMNYVTGQVLSIDSRIM